MPMSARVVAVAATVALLSVPSFSPVRAQTQASSSERLAFEVASVKPHKSGDPSVIGQGLEPGGHFTMLNVTLFQLVTLAYGIRDTQVVGGPSWIKADRFDIMAKAEPNVTKGQVSLLLRSLVADRFGLMVHHETREFTQSTLVLARSDGRFGPNLQPADPDCSAGDRVAASSPPSDQPAQPCGIRLSGGAACCELSARGTTMDLLAMTFAVSLTRMGVDPIVTNATGLDGVFKFDLRWSPPDVVSPSSDGPSIFTALQEQLGLRLNSVKGPVDVLVIDHVEHPTPD